MQTHDISRISIVPTICNTKVNPVHINDVFIVCVFNLLNSIGHNRNICRDVPCFK
jgi:hypothetical protein